VSPHVTRTWREIKKSPKNAFWGCKKHRGGDANPRGKKLKSSELWGVESNSGGGKGKYIQKRYKLEALTAIDSCKAAVAKMRVEG